MTLHLSLLISLRHLPSHVILVVLSLIRALHLHLHFLVLHLLPHRLLILRLLELGQIHVLHHIGTLLHGVGRLTTVLRSLRLVVVGNVLTVLRVRGVAVRHVVVLIGAIRP